MWRIERKIIGRTVSKGGETSSSVEKEKQMPPWELSSKQLNAEETRRWRIEGRARGEQADVEVRLKDWTARERACAAD